MKRLPVDKITDLSEVVTVLKDGGVIAYPTDTIYGLGCSIFSPAGIERIIAIKGRSEKQPLSILVNYIEEIERYAIYSEANLRILRKHLPGPYTFILKASPTIPRNIRGKGDSVGIRVVDSRISTEMADLLGEAIVTTSINRSGEPPLGNPDEIADVFGPEIDLLLDAGIISGKPSTIVDLTGEEPKIIRQGKGIFTP
ncbi:MAG: L-threonylcarbamoyladenylate synthase [Nitrospinota bacterium]|nr:threonylcarbamoyl-AMP synthase [Nitrospinota bacterium]